MSEGAEEAAAADLPDVSDLKTYDVPDPVKVSTSGKSTWLIAAAGIVAACIAMNAVATDHYFAVLENGQETDRNRRRARDWITELPKEQVLPRLDALSDPAVRGRFYEFLGETGDPKYVPDLIAFLRTKVADAENEDGEYYAGRICEALAKMPPAAAGPALTGFWPQAHPEMHKPLIAAITALPAEHVLPGVLAIEDPAVRGRFHHLLAQSGDPNQIDAIMAFVAKESASTTRRFEAEAKSLVAFGTAGTPRLEAALQRTERPIINLAAEALREVNLEFLTKFCRARLDDYGQGMFGKEGLRWAFEVKRAWDELLNKPPAEQVKLARKAGDIKKAKAVLADFETRSFRILEMLKAMGPVKDNEQVDFCFIQGLSSFSKEVAEHCAKALKERLTTEQLVDVMFRFIAKKSAFKIREVDVYKDLLRGTGAAGAVRIGVNLERLLKASAGGLDGVFWMYKLLAHSVLADIGTPSEIPILEQYAKDTDAFIFSRRVGMGKPVETQVKYRDEALKAIAAIKKRAGR